MLCYVEVRKRFLKSEINSYSIKDKNLLSGRLKVFSEMMKKPHFPVLTLKMKLPKENVFKDKGGI